MTSPMVLLTTVSSAFEAKVLAARLGSDGIVWQLRGNVDGVYPVGPVDVLVAADELETARELLLANEVEDALTAADDERDDDELDDDDRDEDERERDGELDAAQPRRGLLRFLKWTRG